jgi:hypothetical protein
LIHPNFLAVIGINFELTESAGKQSEIGTREKRLPLLLPVLSGLEKKVEVSAMS